jgi:hypothetical protein
VFGGRGDIGKEGYCRYGGCGLYYRNWEGRMAEKWELEVGERGYKLRNYK